MDFVKGLGADEVIDYTSQRFEDVVAPVDLVLDGLRGDHIGRSLTVIKQGGKLISLFNEIAGTHWEKIAAEKGVNAYYNAVISDGNDMKQIAALLASGKLRSHVTRTFPLEQTADAHRELELDKTQGKIVISISE
ncbi:hypothetical protein D3C86_1227850 [compost metagenome]